MKAAFRGRKPVKYAKGSLQCMYDDLFSRHGYAFDIAAGVAEAKQFLVSASYSLIITEFQLRDGTGEDFSRLPDKSGNCPSVIVVTSYPEHESLISSSKRMKFEKCFGKPFDLDALLLETERLLA